MGLLLKGFEVEMYTGTPAGEVVGLSHQIVKHLDGFMREPDQRNVEYATAPLRSYDDLLCALLEPRARLRRYLQTLGDYTLLPGSTLPLAGSDHFLRSDPGNPYHDRIESAYGTRVVTSSIHINFGIDGNENILKVCRLLRVDAPILLALSASSPFFDGQATGAHSTRWLHFPQTPEYVPLFTSHRHYIEWVEEQLRLGTMFNVRHLWSSVRPNGDKRPYNINRAELRISDLVSSPCALLGMTALFETRIGDLLAGRLSDPLDSPFTPTELVDITIQNEKAAALHSLDAELIDWQTGQTRTAREWVAQWLEAASRAAKEMGFGQYLISVEKVLNEGNEAMRWLAEYEAGTDLRTIVQESSRRMVLEETDLRERLCCADLLS
jgi:predicted glutamate--cysteine ligase